MESGSRKIQIQVPREIFLRILLTTDVGMSLLYSEIFQSNQEDNDINIRELCLSLQYILEYGYSLCVDENNNLHYTVLTTKEQETEFIKKVEEEGLLECSEEILAKAKKLVKGIETVLLITTIESIKDDNDISSN